MPTALITGIFGQDGSYLAEILAAKGYSVHGVARYPLSENSKRISLRLERKGVRPILHEINLNRFEEVATLLEQSRPDECYHLAATHFSSSTPPEERRTIAPRLYENNVLSASNLIHAVSAVSRQTRLVLAGSCLMFEASKESPQTESTPYRSDSAYGLSKIAAAELARSYRENEGLHLSTAILYNHESPRRDISFVTQKIARQAVLIKENKEKELVLGNLDSRKDWGYAKDYAYGLWLMARQERADDYILATGETHSVAEFVQLAFEDIHIPEWKPFVRLAPGSASGNPAPLLGDPAKAEKKLRWKPSLKFEELVRLMVRSAASVDLD